MSVEDDNLPAPEVGAADETARLSTRLRDEVGHVVRKHSWFIALALAYFLGAYGITRLYGQDFSILLYSKVKLDALVLFAALAVGYRILRSLAIHRPQRPIPFAWRDLMHDFALPRRILHALPPLVLLPVILSAATSFKAGIPAIAPFDWDAPLARIDAALHGGSHPWEILQPLLGRPGITDAIDIAYGPAWLFMLFALQFWQAFTLDPVRHRFFLSYLLCWILLGSTMAALLSSGGPVYYEHLVSAANPFAALMEYLESADQSVRLYALRAQEHLWGAYLSTEVTPGAGISAMPSMHISVATLFVLVAWRYHWALRLVAVAYLLVLLVGSVHLAWHYAIDGYAAILGTYAIWWAVGRALTARR